jgi:DNA repair exonuclease SbcCD ATPase subunit
MNTKRVNTVADAIDRAQKNGKRTAAGIAVELESAQLLMSPEVAAELEQLRSELKSARVDGRRLVQAEQRRAELEAVYATHRDDDQAEIERLLKALHDACDQIAGLQSDLGDAMARVAELEPLAEQLDFLDRTTLPELRRQIEHHEDGKARWRRRAEAAEARVAGLEAPARVREVPDGEHYASVHHSYRLGHDLPPIGGAS